MASASASASASQPLAVASSESHHPRSGGLLGGRNHGISAGAGVGGARPGPGLKPGPGAGAPIASAPSPASASASVVEWLPGVTYPRGTVVSFKGRAYVAEGAGCNASPPGATMASLLQVR